ncbi:MAG: glycine cleavage system aminomethyltransferase GcvT [Pirellulales bacterium]|nr:glycine cleavage system aminomethyltransferase GcvT [Pirellulales bacterium]
MTTELLCTPLHAWHAAHGGRMVDFAGWSMPVQYSSIADEHNATRNAVGVFDISHMGRLQFFGPNTAKFLDSLVTRRVADLKPNQVRYALACNEAGGILDDVLVYGPSADGSRPYSMVVNAGNREKIVAWLTKLAPAAEVTFRDDTRSTAMIAVQGPKAIEVVQPFITAEKPLLEMRYYTCSNGTVAGTAALVSRTGYTGEDGIEIICPAAQATMIWEKCLAAAMPVGGMAVGLGARDTLRLEAAMPLYGHELLETINPLAAGLNFAVNLGGREFLGSKALEKVVDDKAQPVRIGLMLETKRVPREHSAVFAAGNQVGEVTSGTFSPTLQQPIAMAYIQPQQAVEGSTVEVDIRGTMYPATIVPLPFYQRTKKN